MTNEKMHCSNEKCECMASAGIDPAIGEPGETYCGDYCREAYATEEEMDTCACGHPECDSP